MLNFEKKVQEYCVISQLSTPIKLTIPLKMVVKPSDIILYSLLDES